MLVRFLLLLFVTANTLFAVDSTVTTDVELQQALQNLILNGGTSSDTITISNNITISESISTDTSIVAIINPILLPINSSSSFAPENDHGITISASSNVTIGPSAASDQLRGFFIRGGMNRTVGGMTVSGTVIRNITFQNFVAKGGQGYSGGGGLGSGGAIHICNGATVTLENTSFMNCSAAGGDIVTPMTTIGADNESLIGGGASINLPRSGYRLDVDGGSGFGTVGAQRVLGTQSAQGGGSGRGFEQDFAGNAPDSNRFGIGGNYVDANLGTPAGRYAGGAGSPDTIGAGGGDGNFGGGGGRSRRDSSQTGHGGFGGGGAGGSPELVKFGVSSLIPGIGGFAGGDGEGLALSLHIAGGGGGGLGGAIFIEPNAILTIEGTFSLGTGANANSAVAGMGIAPRVLATTQTQGSGDGMAYGQDIFMMSGASLVVNVADGETITVGTPIEGNLGDFTGLTESSDMPASSTGGLTKEGSGILILTGDNTFSGTTTVSAGILRVNNTTTGTSSSLSTPITVNSGGFIDVRDPFVVKSVPVMGTFAAYTGDLNISGGIVEVTAATSSTSALLTVEGSFNHTTGSLQLNIPTDNSNMFVFPRIVFNEAATNNMFDGMLTLNLTGTIPDVTMPVPFTLDFRGADGTTVFVPTIMDGATTNGYTGGDINVITSGGSPSYEFFATKDATSNSGTLSVSSVTYKADHAIAAGSKGYSISIAGGVCTITGGNTLTLTSGNDLNILGGELRLSSHDETLTVGGTFSHTNGTLRLSVGDSGSGNFITSMVTLDSAATNVFDGNLQLRTLADTDVFRTQTVSLGFNEVASYNINNVSAFCEEPCSVVFATPSITGSTNADGNLTSNDVMLNISRYDLAGDFTLDPFTVPFGLNILNMSTTLSGATSLGGDYGLVITGGSVTLSANASLTLTGGPFSHTSATSLTLDASTLSVANGMNFLDTNTITIPDDEVAMSSFSGMLSIMVPAGTDVLAVRDIRLSFMENDGTNTTLITPTYTDASDITVNSITGVTFNSTPLSVNNSIVTLNIDRAEVNGIRTLNNDYDFAIAVTGGTTTIASNSSITGSGNGLTISGGTVQFDSAATTLTVAGAFSHTGGSLILQVDPTTLNTNQVIIRDSAATNSFTGNLTLGLPSNFDPYLSDTVTLNFEEGASGSEVNLEPSYSSVTINVDDIPAGTTISSTPRTISARTVTLDIQAVPAITSSRILNNDVSFPVSVNIPAGTSITGGASITSGGLTLTSGNWDVTGTIVGNVTTASGTTFSGGNISGGNVSASGTFNAPSMITGNVDLSNAATFNSRDSSSITGNVMVGSTTFSGDTSTFNAGNSTITGTVTLEESATFDASSSTITGDLNINGSSTFSSGSATVTGTTMIGSGATLTTLGSSSAMFGNIMAGTGSTISLRSNIGGVNQMALMISDTNSLTLAQNSILNIYIPEGIYRGQTIPLVTGTVNIERMGGNIVADGSYDFQTAGDVTVVVSTNAADSTAFFNNLDYNILGGSLNLVINRANAEFIANIYTDAGDPNGEGAVGLQNQLQSWITAPPVADESVAVINSIPLTASIGTSTTITAIDNAILLPLNATASFGAQNSTTLIDASDASDPSVTTATYTVSGANTYRGFYVRGGMFTLSDITLSMFRAQGGSSTLGGGGLGAGGALYVASGADVSLCNVSITSCEAVGGSVSTGGPVGGASIALPISSDITTFSDVSGGFGFGGNASSSFGGGSGKNASPTAPGNDFADARSGGNSTDRDGLYGGGGAGVEITSNPSADQAAGMGGVTAGGGGINVPSPLDITSSRSLTAGAGGLGGGGGGVQASNAMIATGETLTLVAGSGGFGAGGGAVDISSSAATASSGTIDVTLGSHGFGGGMASTSTGGTGAALGGSIFLEPNATLTISGAFDVSGSTVTATGGASALGRDIFMMSGSTINFASDENITLAYAIESNQGDQTGATAIDLNGLGGITKSGSGILTLQGDNSYTGTTTIKNGVLTFSGNSASLSSNVVVENDVDDNTAMAELLINNTLSINSIARVDDNFTGSPGNLTVSSGVVNVNNSNSLSIAGALTVDGGTVNISGSSGALSAGSINISSRTVGATTFSGVINLTGTSSTITTTGDITIESGGTLHMPRNSTVSVDDFIHNSGGTLSLDVENNNNLFSSPAIITINDPNNDSTSQFNGTLELNINAITLESILVNQNITLGFSETASYADANITPTSVPSFITLNSPAVMRTNNSVALSIEESTLR